MSVRRLITHLVILSLLAINVAWAVDDCAAQDLHEAADVTLSADFPDHSQPDTAGDDDICDVPCIGWLHLVAITSGTKLDDFPFTHPEVARTGLSFHSLAQAPPIRPPQI